MFRYIFPMIILKQHKFLLYFLTSVFLLIYISYEVTPMSKHLPTLILSPLNFDSVDAIWGLRLVKSNKEVVLFDAVLHTQDSPHRYQTILSATVLEKTMQKRKPVFTIQQLLPTPPGWDIISQQDNTYLCVIEQAGGAINKLAFFQENGLITPVTKLHNFDSFSKPRFVKGNLSQLNISISTISDEKKLVVFPAQKQPGIMEYKELGEWFDGILLRLTTGYILIAKHTVPGEVRYGVMPGTLEFIILDDHFRITHKIIKPLDQQIIYEFDATLISRNTHSSYIVLLATGKNHPLLKVSDELGNLVDTIQIRGQYDERKLAKPAIVTTENRMYMAIVEGFRETDARLLTGSIVFKPISDDMQQ